MGIGGSVLFILTQFLSNRSTDHCRSKLVDVVSEVPEGRVLGPLLLTLQLIGYADNSILMAVVHPQALELQLQSP